MPDVPMTVQENHVVFLYYYDGRHSIDNCGSSGLLSEKKRFLRTIRLLMKNGHDKQP